ncbi:MAG: response regulator [Thermodesulfovibrionales bacterium]
MDNNNNHQGEKLAISILYVEDEEITRSAVARMLKRRVLNVYEAENGQEGLELYKQYRPDIVISDIRMPVLDGMEMSKEIKALDKNSKIILTTAHSDASILINSIEVGIDKYILKPLDIASLFSSVEKCAENIMLEKKIQQQNKEKDELIAKLQNALDKVKFLSGLLPICSSCKKIRDDKGYWQQIESYVREHSEAQFTHGLCPDCLTKLYPNLIQDLTGEK